MSMWRILSSKKGNRGDWSQAFVGDYDQFDRNETVKAAEKAAARTGDRYAVVAANEMHGWMRRMNQLERNEMSSMPRTYSKELKNLTRERDLDWYDRKADQSDQTAIE